MIGRELACQLGKRKVGSSLTKRGDILGKKGKKNRQKTVSERAEVSEGGRKKSKGWENIFCMKRKASDQTRPSRGPRLSTT